MSSNSKLDELIDRLPVRTRPSYGYQPLMDEAADAIEALRSTPPQPGQERKDKALMAVSMRALEVEPHLEVYLSRDDFEHIFQQAFEAYDNVMRAIPTPTEAPPVESQAAEIRAKALEEAAKIADAAGIEWAADAELWLKDGHPNTAAVSKQHSRAAENVAASIRAALAAEGSAE